MAKEKASAEKELSAEKTFVLAQEKEEKFIICNMCGYANSHKAAICKMCSNYLEGEK